MASHRVRELGVEGFDAFLSEYELEAFDGAYSHGKRKVTRKKLGKNIKLLAFPFI